MCKYDVTHCSCTFAPVNKSWWAKCVLSWNEYSCAAHFHACGWYMPCTGLQEIVGIIVEKLQTSGYTHVFNDAVFQNGICRVRDCPFMKANTFLSALGWSLQLQNKNWSCLFAWSICSWFCLGKPLYTPCRLLDETWGIFRASYSSSTFILVYFGSLQ